MELETRLLNNRQTKNINLLSLSLSFSSCIINYKKRLSIKNGYFYEIL